MIDKPALDALRGLIAKWLEQAAGPGSVGDGPWEAGEAWKAKSCAYELYALLASLVLPQGPETPQWQPTSADLITLSRALRYYVDTSETPWVRRNEHLAEAKALWTRMPLPASPSSQTEKAK